MHQVGQLPRIITKNQILRKITGREIKEIVIVSQTNFHFLRITYKSISLQRNVVLWTARLEVTCLWFNNNIKCKKVKLPFHVITLSEIRLASLTIWFNIQYDINIRYMYINIFINDDEKTATTPTQLITKLHAQTLQVYRQTASCSNQTQISKHISKRSKFALWINRREEVFSHISFPSGLITQIHILMFFWPCVIV